MEIPSLREDPWKQWQRSREAGQARKGNKTVVVMSRSPLCETLLQSHWGLLRVHGVSLRFVAPEGDAEVLTACLSVSDETVLIGDN